MAKSIDYFQLIRGPLVLAAAVVVLRLVLELAGAPNGVITAVGVAWLHMLVPIYFGLKIGEMRLERPFVLLMRATFYWALPVRLLIAVTYVLAYIYQIDSPRFRVSSLGPVGEGVSALQGYLLLPLANFISWMLYAMVLSAIFGGLTLKYQQRRCSDAIRTM